MNSTLLTISTLSLQLVEHIRHTTKYHNNHSPGQNVCVWFTLPCNSLRLCLLVQYIPLLYPMLLDIINFISTTLSITLYELGFDFGLIVRPIFRYVILYYLSAW